MKIEMRTYKRGDGYIYTEFRFLIARGLVGGFGGCKRSANF